MKKILAIDDKKDNLVTINAVLKSQLNEITIINATSGEEGIKKANIDQPDTIILDIIMPTMDGYEVCKKLKEDQNTRHIPIIMLTAINTDSESRIKGLMLGADAFLSKPIDPIELATQVKVMLRIKEAEDKLRSENILLEDLVKERTTSLYESQEKYKALYNNAPLPYQSLSGDGTFRDVNPAWLNALGYERDEVIGTYFSDYLHPDWQAIFPDRFKKFKEVGTVSGVDFKIRHKNGHYLEILYEGCIGLDSDGKFKHTYCVFQDVTESNRAKKQLIESEDYYRTLIENSSDYISIVDNKGNMLHRSEPEKNILGYLQEEIMTKNIFDLVHPDDKKKLASHFNNLQIDGSTVDQVNFRFLHKDGSWKYLEGSARNMISHPRINGIVLNYRDNTKQINIEESKKESDRKLNTLINNLRGIAYRCKNDENWTMEYLSAGFEYITGYKTHDVINNNKISFNQIIHPDDRNRIHKEISQAVNSDKNFEIRYRIINASGKTIYVQEKGVGTYSDSDKEVNYLEGYISDISETLLAEEEINKLTSAVEQSPSVIVITDTNGIIEYINPIFTKITGYTQQDALGQKSNVLKSGDQSPDIYRELWETISKGEIWKGEFHNKKKDGSLFWESASISPIFNNNGKITNYIKIAEDITAIRKSDKALQESEKKYKKLIETSGEGFWLIDPEGVTLDVNISLCNMLGYKKDEMIGKSPYDFVDEENDKIFRKQISRANSDSQRTYEVCLRSISGVCIPTRFNATSISDNDGNFAGSFAFVANITESKRAELIQKVLYNISNAVITTDDLNALIRHIQKELSVIIDTTNFFVALYDKETEMLSLPFFSDEKDKMVSIPSGKSLTDYVIKTKKSLLANSDVKRKLIEQGKLERFGSDSKIWLGVPLNIEGEVIGVLVVQSYSDENAFKVDDMKMLEFVSDQVSISINRKKTEGNMKKALVRATESDRLKTAFLQNISHEIRTPMNGIMGFTDLLKDSTLSGEERSSYLDVILISGNRMLNTLNDLMDMSMLETGQVKMKISPTNINNELSILYDFYKLEIENKGMEINYSAPLPSAKITINTDREKLFAILSNLIKNAIKYSKKGNVEFGYNKKGSTIEFFVKDNGIGIPENRLIAIFERFVQADIDDVKVHEGSGLGLSISKAYIELLGGNIWVESEYGEGSQFYFTLPYNPVHVEEIIVKEESGINHHFDIDKKVKILIAEDEAIATEYLSIILDDPNIEILYANNGSEAVEICRKNIDLGIILMDIKMPIMDGFAATTSIRTFNDKVIIIAQTAYALAGDREKAIDAGCNDYISKPIDKERLLDMIDSYIK